MMNKCKNFFVKYKYQLLIILVMALVGSCMHFVHDIFSSDLADKILGSVFPIRESVAEHMKMLWYPFLVTGIILAIKKKDIAHFGSFVIGGFLSIFLTLGLFMFYVSFAGKSLLWLDIILFFIVFFVCGMLAFDLTRLVIIKKSWLVWILLACGVTALLIVITFLPGNGIIFQDDKGLEKIAQALN